MFEALCRLMSRLAVRGAVMVMGARLDGDLIGVGYRVRHPRDRPLRFLPYPARSPPSTAAQCRADPDFAHGVT